MKKLIFCICVPIITIGCNPKADFLVLSNKIYNLENHSKRFYSTKRNRLEKEVRKIIFTSDSTKFLQKPITDTIFILQGFNSESNIFFGDIWNKQKRIIYRYVQDRIQYDKLSALDDFQFKLVRTWDTVRIRKEEKEHPLIDNSTVFKAMRCYKENNRWKIDTVFFNNFRNFHNHDQN
jgi:precorrin-6B methylase 2